MTATAWDKGSPRKSANITINVDVIDVNDNSPVFTSPNRQNQTVAATIQSDDVIIQIIVSIIIIVDLIIVIPRAIYLKLNRNS